MLNTVNYVTKSIIPCETDHRIVPLFARYRLATGDSISGSDVQEPDRTLTLASLLKF